jgi:hypothetical protein
MHVNTSLYIQGAYHDCKNFYPIVLIAIITYRRVVVFHILLQTSRITFFFPFLFFPSMMDGDTIIQELDESELVRPG